MNIFRPCSTDSYSAIVLDNSRLGKQILENAQIISTAIHRLSPTTPSDIYKPFNTNGRFAVWCAESRYNFNWLVSYSKALHTEYIYRFGKPHASFAIILIASSYIQLFPTNPRTEAPGCKQAEALMKTGIDLYQAYRDILAQKWKAAKKPPVWTKRPTPHFYTKSSLTTK